MRKASSSQMPKWKRDLENGRDLVKDRRLQMVVPTGARG